MNCTPALTTRRDTLEGACRYCEAPVQLAYAGRLREGESLYQRWRVIEHSCRRGWSRVREPATRASRALSEREVEE